MASSLLPRLAACASLPWPYKVCESSLSLADACGHGLSVTHRVSVTELNRRTQADTEVPDLQQLAKGSKLNCTMVDWVLKFTAVFPAFRRVLRSALW